MLAIAGGKGGCGKTTTALGLATALAREGRTPLVVDADRAMADLHVLADVPHAPGVPAVAAGQPLESVAHTTPGHQKVSVLPAGTLESEWGRTTLDQLRSWDGSVIVDCPAGCGRDAAVPLRVADDTLLVTTPTQQSLVDATKTAAMARELAAEPIGSVIVNRQPAGHTPDTDTPTDAADALLECPLLERVPRAKSPVLAGMAVRRSFRRLARKVQERNI